MKAWSICADSVRGVPPWGVRTFEDLVAEAEAADVTGWSWEWLEGRATEQRPPWGYARLLATRLGTVRSALDLDTGGGEVLAQVPRLPPVMSATEGWPPNAAQARDRLGPRGVDVREVRPGDQLPFPDATFELVTSRHPVRPVWTEVHRVLAPGGCYLAQHVGPASAFELIEYLLGPLPEQRKGRDPRQEVHDAEAAGLAVTNLRIARLRIEFYDIGAVVWLLRRCVWWVPGFTVAAYLPRLRSLDAIIRTDGVFVAHSARHLIEAVR